MASNEDRDPPKSSEDDDKEGIKFRGAAVSTILPPITAQTLGAHATFASKSVEEQRSTIPSPIRQPFPHPNPGFANVASALQHAASAARTFRSSGWRPDLDEAIRGYWNLHLILMPRHPDYLPCRYQLCNLLCERFDLWGAESDINKAVELGEELSATSGVPDKDRVNYLRSCARALALRFDGTTQAEDAVRAATLVEQAESLAVEGSSIERDLLIWHGRALYYLYEAKNDFRRLQEAIRSLSCTLDDIDDHSDCKPQCLLFLSEAHRRRQDKLNEASEVEKISTYVERAVTLARARDPRRPRYLNGLAIALQRQYLTRSFKAELLHRAIAVSKEAVQTCRTEDRRYTATLTTTSNGLRYRYHLLGDFADINECVQVQEKSLKLRPKQQNGYNAALHGLCLSLIFRFRSNGSLQDIDRSIALLQERRAELPSSVAQRVQLTNCLSMGFLERWYLFNSLSDLNESLRLCKEVVLSMNAGGYLANIGVCYYELYLHSANTEDLNSAIEWMTKADGRRDSIYDLPEHLLAYGHALTARAKLLQQVSDWGEGLELLRSAVENAPAGHRRRSQALRTLGSALRDRYRVDLNVKWLEESLEILQSCVDKEAAGLEGTKCRIALADTVVDYREVSKPASYPVEVLALLEKAASDTQALFADRFNAALKWAQLAQDNALPQEAYRAYVVAVSLLPRVAWLGYGRNMRLQELRTRAGSLAVDAAAAAIAVGRFDKAIEVLELGRGIFWRQLLQLRTEVDELQEVAPALAREMQDVGRALEADVPSSGGLENEHLLQRHRRLAERWEQLVGEVRAVDGFEDFLQAKTFSQLSEAAKEGPVVIINGSTTRVDALIITQNRRNYHCALPAIQARLAIQLSEFLRHALSVPKDQRGLAFMERAIRNVLDRLWHTVVSPIRVALRTIYPDELPRRIWLLPTGPFCLLPIHAAGFSSFQNSGPGNDIVCSYTATLDALIRARKANRSPSRSPKLLAISQSETPGQEPLACSSEEMCIVQSTALRSTVTCLCGRDATVSRFREELQKDVEWVHLSCHGNSSPENPLESCFRFYDGPLSLSDISKLRVPHADFAFLSACHTARPAGELPDESLHLAASLQLAGFKSVIATQWGIADKDAPVVTKDVYEHMTGIGQNDFCTAAEALHGAVANLKRRGFPAIRWVPFVHLGI